MAKTSGVPFKGTKEQEEKLKAALAALKSVDGGLMPALQTAQEIYGYLQGEYPLADAVDKIKLNTKHYAKRQITFFKRLDGLKLLPPENPKSLAERIAKDL